MTLNSLSPSTAFWGVANAQHPTLGRKNLQGWGGCPSGSWNDLRLHKMP